MSKKSVAYFVIKTPPDKKGFRIKLTEKKKIRQARRILAKKEAQKIVIGKIVKRRVSYNKRWGFYLKPKSINFAELAVEVCDARASYVQKNLKSAGGAFLPGRIWCPWSTVLIKEISYRQALESD